MGIITQGSFATSEQGTYKINETTVYSAAASALSRSDAIVTPTITTDLSSKTIVGTVTVSGGGDKGTAATNATNTFTFGENAFTAASGTVTVTNHGNVTAGDHSIAIVTTNGTTVTATSHASTTTSTNTDSPTFALGADANAMAANIATCLNANDELTATASTNAVTVTQVYGGADGNTTITLTDPGSAGLSKADFTGGTVTAPSSATITLIGGDPARTVTFTAKARGADAYSNEFNLTSVNAAATNLYNLIVDANKGLGTARMTVSKTNGTLACTHQPAGALGNTEVTMAGNFQAYLSVNPDSYFSGGADRTKIKFVMQLSNDGVNWTAQDESIVIISDVDTSVTGTYAGIIKKEDMVAAPYYRTGLNVDQGNNINGSSNTLAVKQGFSYNTLET